MVWIFFLLKLSKIEVLRICCYCLNLSDGELRDEGNFITLSSYIVVEVTDFVIGSALDVERIRTNWQFILLKNGNQLGLAAVSN